MGRGSSRFDVEQCGTHPPDKLNIDVEQPNNTSGPLRELRILELLGHWTNQPTQASRPDAKKTARSKLQVSGDDIGQGELLYEEAHSG